MKKTFEFLTVNGRAAPNISVSVYNYGTLTLATLWADSAGTIPKVGGNPMTTDVNGYYEFYVADGRYSIGYAGPGIVSSTLTDLIIDDTINPVTADASRVGADDGASGSLWTTVQGFINKILSSAGASVVGFIQSGTGAVARWVQDKLRERVSVFDFMTAAQIADVQAGTALVNVSAAIQVAINFLMTRGGGKLFIPYGRYLCNSTIKIQNTVSKSICLHGEGRGNALVPNTATGSIFVANTGGIFLDCAGGSNVELSSLGIMAGSLLSNQSTIGILFQRTATNHYCEQVKLTQVSIGLSSKPAANGGLGTIALANKRGEGWEWNSVALYADIPLLSDAASAFPTIVSPDFAEYTAAGTTGTLNSFVNTLFISPTGDASKFYTNGMHSFTNCYWNAPIGFSAMVCSFCYHFTFQGSADLEGAASSFARIIGSSRSFSGKFMCPTGSAKVGFDCTAANLTNFNLYFEQGYSTPLSGLFFSGDVFLSSAAGQANSLMASSTVTVHDDGSNPTPNFVGGIKVNNTSISDASTLDWYLETTDSAVVAGQTTAGAGTYTTQNSRSTRFGNRVTIEYEFVWTAHTGTGNLIVTGLPYACADTSSPVNAFVAGIAAGAGKQLMAAVVGSTIRIYASDPSTGVVSQIALPATGSLYLSGVYRV